ncbi:MAG: metallophosphoesterase [Anaerolineales bacterium]|nr:metallophosphoesterase [Anaerolineales bacterium]
MNKFTRLLITSLLVIFLSQITCAAPSPGSTVADSVVLVGAGDISSCDNDNDEATAQLLDNIPGTVFILGDNVYIDGTYDDFINCYHPTWGRHKDRTRPVPGNHEYFTADAAGYFQYFNNVSAYYAYDLGDWRIYALNSEIDVSSTGAQVQWLKNDLAENPRLCVLAYWHKPLWSSRYKDGNDDPYETLWKTLYDAGAELVLNGHIHNYERFKEMNADGLAASPGLREIVVGTGGVNLDGYVTSLSTSEVRNASTYGVLKLDLSPTKYSWQFVPVAGKTFKDSGNTDCH